MISLLGEERTACFTLPLFCAVSGGLIAVPLGVIGRLSSVVVAIPGHTVNARYDDSICSKTRCH